MRIGTRFETFAGVAALAVAALLRVPALGVPPLDPAEAAQAVAAWWAVEGGGMPLSLLEPAPSSALLLGLQSVVFFLFAGTSDLLARVVPVAVGLALVLAPAIVRVGSAYFAWTLAVLLAVDPWLVAHSRRGEGAILAVAAAVCCQLLSMRLSASRRNGLDQAVAARLWMGWAVGVGLLLASGTVAWSLLPPVLVGALVAGRAMGDGADRVRPPVRLAVVAGAAALVGSTSGLVQWQGPALWSISLESWLGGWQGATGGLAMPLRSAVAPYEAALVLLALVGLAGPPFSRGPGAQGGDVFDRAPIVLWLAWGALLQLRLDRAEGWLVFQVPLLLAAALGAARLACSPALGRSRWRRAAAGIGLLLAGAAGLGGTGARHRSQPTTLPSVRRLAIDVGAVAEHSGPTIVVSDVDRSRADATLAWYLRRWDLRWSSSLVPAREDAGGGALVLAVERIPSDAPAADLPGRGYALRRDDASTTVVEVR